MTDKKYEFNYTNHFTYPRNRYKQKENELTIIGDCKITNYTDEEEFENPKEGTTYIKAEFKDGKRSIMSTSGKSNLCVSSEARFSDRKYSIFAEVAALDGNAAELSESDIQKIDKSLIQKLGLKDINLADIKKGIVTLIWGDNDILKIDFSEDNKVSEEQNRKDDNTDISKIALQAVHTVKKGESIAKLAQKYGVNTPEIIAVNPQIPKDSIKKKDDGTLHVALSIGNKINIPVPKKMDVIQFKDIDPNEQAFLDQLAYEESKNGKNTNSAGKYLGHYQIGEEALIAIKVYKKDGTTNSKEGNDWKLKKWPENNFGIRDKEDFLENKSKQDSAIIAIMRFNWDTIDNKIDLDKYIGKKIKGITITKSGILAGAHLCGAGNLIKFLKSNGEEDAKDGNDVPISRYINDFSCFGDNVPKLTSPLYIYK